MTLFKKCLATLGLAVFVISIVFAAAVLTFVNSLYYETNARALSRSAAGFISLFSEERFAEYFSSGGGDFPGERFPGTGFPAAAKNGSFRFTLIAVNGEVLWDSDVEERMVNHIDRDEIQAALEGREGRAVRKSITTGSRQLYVSLPIHGAGGKVVGVFRLSVIVPGFWQLVFEQDFPFVVLACLLVTALLVSIILFSRSLAASADRLVYLAREANRESHAPDLPLSPGADRWTPAEFLTLENTLKNMSEELLRRFDKAHLETLRLQAILGSISGAVFAMDAKLNLILANPRACAFFELGDKNIEGMTLLEAVRSTELEWAARKVLSDNKPQETELKIHSGGAERCLHIFTAPLSPVTGETEAAGVVMVIEDLTRIFRLEQIRKDFVANVSHELRTPIQLTKGFSETLLDSSLEDTEEVRRFVTIIRKNAGNMENLTNDLLSLANLDEEAPGRREKEDCEIAPLFVGAVSSVEPQAKKKKIHLSVDCPEKLKARLHASFIIQALINLLDNAIKYSPEGSRVSARAEEIENELVLEIKDEGIGIPAEHCERIFERFYRVDKARSREAGGTGLGLAIVRHIALLHGGKAEVESHAGEGSVFRIRIPLADCSEL